MFYNRFIYFINIYIFIIIFLAFCYSGKPFPTINEIALEISEITVTDITTNSANINWNSNILSSGTVEYGIDINYGNSALHDGLLISHVVNLTNLSPATLYHFRVISNDNQGNSITSADGTFTTLTEDLEPPEISNIKVINITLTSTTVTWDTNESATSKIEYGLDTNYGTNSSSDTYSTTHSIDLTSLSSATLYHFRVSGKDEKANENVSLDNTFTTLTPDTTPPVISNVKVINITQTTASVTWDTDEDATSKVMYGTNTTYGSEQELTDYTKNHSIPLSGLTSATVYHYKIITKDKDGNETISPDYVFYTGNCALCGIQEKPDPVLINPVISQNGKAYYPSVVYDKDHFGNNIDDYIKTEGGPGTDKYKVTPYYKVLYSNNSSPTNCNFAYSEDGITWYHADNDGLEVVPTSPTGYGGYHPHMIYNASGWKTITGRNELDHKYLIWIWEYAAPGAVIGLFTSDDGVTLTRVAGLFPVSTYNSDFLNSTVYPGSASPIYGAYVLYDKAETDPNKKFKVWSDDGGGRYWYAYSSDARTWTGGTLVTMCTDTCTSPKWQTTLTADFNIGDTTFQVADMNAISYYGNGYPITIDSEQITYQKVNPTDTFFTVIARGYNSTTTANHTSGSVITQATFIFTNGSCSPVRNESLGAIEIWFSTNALGKGKTDGGSTNNRGIGYARTTNGYEWTPIDNITGSGQVNPILSTNDGLNPNRNAGLLSGYTYTPCIVYDPDRFSGHGEAREYKLWFTGGLDGNGRRVFYLSFDGFN